MTYLKDITASGASGVTVDGIWLIMDAECAVEIDSLDDSITCSRPTNTPTSVTVTADTGNASKVNKAIYIAMAIIGSLVVVLLGLICAIYIYNKSGYKYKHFWRLV